jgi:hypothetical protein
MRVWHRASVFVFALLLSVAPAFAADAPNTLSEKEKAEGWKLLFDGKTTKGWRNYQKDTISDGWKVADGALSRTEKDAGDIITDGQYGAFELTLDYNISPGGNSGLMYHVQESEKRPWQTGPEIQIQDNKDGHDPQKAGWLYQFYSSDKDATKPAGEWNTLRIVITPEKCEHYMNGVKYFDYVKGSDDWNARLEKSKFKAFANFGKATSGHICLQDHGNLVSFRNVKIRDLSKEKKAAAAKPAPKAEAKPVVKAEPKPASQAAAKAPTAPAAPAGDAAAATAATEAPAATGQQTTTYRTTRRQFQPLRRLRSLLDE